MLIVGQALVGYGVVLAIQGHYLIAALVAGTGSLVIWWKMKNKKVEQGS